MVKQIEDNSERRLLATFHGVCVNSYIVLEAREHRHPRQLVGHLRLTMSVLERRMTRCVCVSIVRSRFE